MGKKDSGFLKDFLLCHFYTTIFRVTVILKNRASFQAWEALTPSKGYLENEILNEVKMKCFEKNVLIATFQH